MKLKANLLGILIVFVIFGGIGISNASGLWKTESDKVPATYQEGEYAGTYNPADIRGSYSFEEISELFAIDLQILYEAFQVPGDTDGSVFKSKDMEGLYEDFGYEVGNESVRIFVALYKNLPIILSDSYLPKSAVELIKEANPSLTKEQLDYLEAYEINETAANTNQGAIEAPDQKAEITLEESENGITGTTTFQKALDAGITKDEIEEVIQGPMPSTNQTIKDYCVEKGLSFKDIKDRLNSIIN